MLSTKDYDFTVRELFDMDLEEVSRIPKGVHRVLYEDGVILSCKHNYLKYDKFIWRMFEGFEDVTITSKTCTKGATGDDPWDAGTTDKALEACLQHICEQKGLRAYEDKEILNKRGMAIPTMIQNELVHRIGHKVLPMSAIDVVKVLKDPDILVALEDELPTPEAIDRCNQTVVKVARTSDKPYVIYKAVKSGAARTSSFAQLYGRRGYITDLNGIVFPQPIMGGFARGLGPKYYPPFIEGRTAAKAYNATIDSIKKSEWASRRIQKVSMPVQFAINYDCGTKNLMPLFLDELMLANGHGLYYSLPEDPEVVMMMKPTDKHLVGKEILIRVPWLCNHPNPHDTCIFCAGEVFNNFPRWTNMGYTSAAFMMEIVSQYNLSLKHIIASITGSLLRLEGKSAKYFEGNELNEIEFVKIPQEDLDKLFIVLNGGTRELGRLGDVLNSSIKELDTTSIGEIHKVVLGISDDEGKVKVLDDINIGANNLTVHISNDLIEHIKQSKYELSDSNRYVIPMKGWDIKKPLFEVPIKENDMNAFLTRLESMFEGGTDKKDDIPTHFYKLCKLVLPNIAVPMSAMIAMTYAITTYNPDMGNYRLGRGSPVSRFSTRDELFRNRSLTPFLIGGRQAISMMSNPTELINDRYRESSPLDVLIMPDEVVKVSKKKR